MLDHIVKIATFMLEAYEHAWPYLLVTIPLAVAVNLSGIASHINKAFSARPVIAILLATAVGAFSPFCSCGVIPIITAMLIGGVPLAPVMSFWLASPSMDPEVFFLSVSQLGLDLAVWRLAGTFAMSLGGGFITHYLIKLRWLSTDVLKNQKAEVCQCATASEPAPVPAMENALAFQKLETSPATAGASCSSGSCGCGSSEPAREDWKKKILNETGTVLFMIIKFMSLAFFLEALIVLYLPEAWIINLLGQGNRFAIPLSTVVGIPLYTTNLTALGLMGGLLQQGMNPGAALAFLIGGATTTIPAMAAVYGIVKKRVFFLYVLFALSAALLTGYLYEIVRMFI